MRMAILVFLWATAVALADTPAVAPSTPQPAAAAATSSAPAAHPALTAEALAAAKKKAGKLGYKLRVKDGEALFCRTDATLGTRFVTEKCLRESQVDADSYNVEQAQQMLNQRPCGSPGCSAR
ncbi:MAG TPA: hypothetical protein VMU00_11835 [Steroidobacteraceae bacterium]|nr:hypothetical protein [Steroidobacteraceae bacterium]